MAGADLFAIMKATGHVDIRTTMIYVSLGKSHIREQVEKLNAISDRLFLNVLLSLILSRSFRSRLIPVRSGVTPAFQCGIAGCLPMGCPADFQARHPVMCPHDQLLKDMRSSGNQLIANWALRFLAQKASLCPMTMGRSFP